MMSAPRGTPYSVKSIGPGDWSQIVIGSPRETEPFPIYQSSPAYRPSQQLLAYHAVKLLLALS
jgi:hypothetical protein